MYGGALTNLAMDIESPSPVNFAGSGAAISEEVLESEVSPSESINCWKVIGSMVPCLGLYCQEAKQANVKVKCKTEKCCDQHRTA